MSLARKQLVLGRRTDAHRQFHASPFYRRRLLLAAMMVAALLSVRCIAGQAFAVDSIVSKGEAAASRTEISEPSGDLIEEHLAVVWKDSGVMPSSRADNYTLVRRIYLDLVGRIPQVSELRRAVAGESFDYGELVDHLLCSPDFDTHMAAVWTRWLLPRDVDLDRFGGTAAFSDWLAGEFRNQTRYDEIVRQLLLAEGRVSTSGPVLLTTALEMKPDQLAKQTARTFLGTRIDCAMCHDHPYDDWTQSDFWGYAALFARISRPSGKMQSISSVLRVKDVGFGEVTLPESDIVVPPKLLGGDVLKEQPGSTLRRKELADWLTSTHNRQFARATVNRVWSHFFGAGLVDPPDDFGSHNPPLSKDLLEKLADDFVASNYGIRQLIRQIVHSSVYQQSSRQAALLGRIEASRPLFNSMPVRWLDAATLYDSLAIAAGGLAQPQTSATNQGIRRIGDAGRSAFIDRFGAAGNSPLQFQSGIPQALTLMNGTVSTNASSETQSRLLQSLGAPFFDDDDRIETIFLSTVGRPPTETQRKVVASQLSGLGTDVTVRQQILSDVAWALLNSAEFATNH